MPPRAQPVDEDASMHDVSDDGKNANDSMVSQSLA